MSVFIIAEAGVNHNGDVATAKKLIDAAADAGADAVKFQTFKTDRIVTRQASKAAYQTENTDTDDSQYEMLKRLELSETAHQELFTYCSNKNITFMSTPFDEESADFLDKLGMDIFKIPSGEITNKALIKHIASKRRPVILSTGMSYMEEVKKAVDWIDEAWAGLKDKPQLTLLHCTSNYPAAMTDINLRAIETMRKEFGLPVGYSDHTMGIEVSVAAAALGASIIEKHLTLDRTMQGPDHKASLEPQEMRNLVQAIRHIEQALGDGIKSPSSAEESVRIVARKSLIAARTLAAGDVIKPNDITVKRPGSGIAPEFSEAIIGKKAAREIEEDSVIQWDDISDA